MVRLSIQNIGYENFASIFAFSWYYVASALGMIGLIGWFWPERPLEVNQ